MDYRYEYGQQPPNGGSAQHQQYAPIYPSFPGQPQSVAQNSYQQPMVVIPPRNPQYATAQPYYHVPPPLQQVPLGHAPGAQQMHQQHAQYGNYPSPFPPQHVQNYLPSTPSQPASTHTSQPQLLSKASPYVQQSHPNKTSAPQLKRKSTAIQYPSHQLDGSSDLQPSTEQTSSAGTQSQSRRKSPTPKSISPKARPTALLTGQNGSRPQLPTQQPLATQERHAIAHPQQLQSSRAYPFVEIPARKPSEDASNLSAGLDYPALLLSFANEYITSAHKMSAVLAAQQREEYLQQYHKLIATGLACMEAVLKNFTLHPRTEASLRLRYATALFEDTDNDYEAETVLAKGINLCERNRLQDLKYNMQHLNARLTFKSNQRAGLKYIDNLIPDIEAYSNAPWLYAFRFLRLSLSLQSSIPTEMPAALHQLHQIANQAETRDDRAIIYITAVIEALVHLRMFSVDSLERGQRAVATARSFQFDERVKSLSRVTCFLTILELAYSILTCNLKQIPAQREAMQNALESEEASNRTPEGDGSVYLPIEKAERYMSDLSNSEVFQKHGDGRIRIRLNMPGMGDLMDLGFYLSAISYYHGDMRQPKSKPFLDEGFKRVQGHLNDVNFAPGPLVAAQEQRNWRKLLAWHFQLSQAFFRCLQGNWTIASDLLKGLRARICAIAQPLPPAFSRSLDLLEASIDQGQGDTEKALSMYLSPSLSLPQSPNVKYGDPDQDALIVAALNAAFITSNDQHPQHHLCSKLISRLEPLCLRHPNGNYGAAFQVLKSANSSQQGEAIIAIKNNLHKALNAAKEVDNKQLLLISFNLMTLKLFNGIIGERSEQIAQAARSCARQIINPLWMSVADGMLAQTLEKEGRKEDAAKCIEEVRSCIDRLPEGVKKRYREG